MKFKDSTEYQDILKECYFSKTDFEKFNFKCFSDGVFTFNLKKDNFIYEINLICDDIIFQKMTFHELADLKNIEYFEHSIYNGKEFLSGRTFKFSFDPKIRDDVETNKDLEDLWFSEDYGEGFIRIKNTKIDENIDVILESNCFDNPEKFRQVVNSFFDSLRKLIRKDKPL